MKERRSGIKIMLRLIGLIKPLLPIMAIAVLTGVAGFLCAIFLTVVAANGVIRILLDNLGDLAIQSQEGLLSLSLSALAVILIVMAVMRGVLHYVEQYCNHYIAFKLLAMIRHKIFAALRRLCPAKLEGRDKGDLISMVTSDIELLEVFYAHTISPIAIAILTCLIMVGFIATYSAAAAIVAALAYVTVGVVIPIIHGKIGGGAGMRFRSDLGELNSYILDSLRGIDETIQYGDGANKIDKMREKSENLAGLQKKLSKVESGQRSFTNLAILVFSIGLLVGLLMLWNEGGIEFQSMLISSVALMGSFGPVVALSNLSNNLNQTLACGERVLSLLEEEPKVYDVKEGKTVKFEGVKVDKVKFSYEDEVILDDYSLNIEKNSIVGIHGPSGSGKSTLLKLIMRFWDVDAGNIKISDCDVRELNTENLRDIESYVTQDTHMFNDSIAKNIALGNIDATNEEIVEAAKKASIHDFIMTLPRGYDTNVGELGDTLSGGEKQRIGVARAFLHSSSLLLLDEPTSNLDALNEGIILKSLKEACEEKTVILVSHRKSTMNIVDSKYEMQDGRLS